MEKNIFGWAVEHVTKNNEVNVKYIRINETDADDLLSTMKENDLSPKTGFWRKVPVYTA